MNAGRIRVVIGKDWAELRQARSLIVTTLGVSLLLVGVFLGVAIYAPGAEDLDLTDSGLRESVASPPGLEEVESLGGRALGQVFLLRQLVLLLLMIPEFATMAIATYSVIGEKRAGSLEPLLATPITTAELLAAKCLTAGIPGIGITWLLFGLSAAAVWFLTSPAVVRVALDGNTFLLVFLVAPLVALLGSSLGVIASSRASDARSAQQIGIVVILPLLGLMVLQLGGIYRLTPGAILAGAGVLAAANLLVLRLGVLLFRREVILTRWR